VFTDPNPSCERCAATVGPYVNTADGCPRCRGESFAFDGALRLGTYEGPLREVILRLKHAHNEGLAEIVAAAWAERSLDKLHPLSIASVVPVPLHWWRRWQRGYNQSEALARTLAQSLGVPCQTHAVRRVRRTVSQANLSLPAGRENVRGASGARRGGTLGRKTVLLVDDVMTTGRTVHEVARELRNGGAGRVIVAMLARAEM